MSDVDKSSKTEPPTEKKLSEAKSKGQFPKAPEISMALTLLAGLLCMLFFAPSKASQLRDLQKAYLRILNPFISIKKELSSPCLKLLCNLDP